MWGKSMDKFAKLPKKQLLIILITSLGIILSICLETLMRAKDINLFNEWLINLGYIVSSELEYQEYFNSYIAINLSQLFLKVIIPMTFSIHSYFAFSNLRVNKLFVFIWTVLLLGGLAYVAVELNLQSVFYYINITGYLILLGTVLSLIRKIDESKFS